MSHCPVCFEPAPIKRDDLDIINSVNCKRCGNFKFKRKEFGVIHEKLVDDKDADFKVSYALRKITASNPEFLLTHKTYNSLASETILPTPPEQLENLIYFLGESNYSDPGKQLDALTEDHISIIGVKSFNSIGYIVESAQDKGLISAFVTSTGGASPNFIKIVRIRLTMDGWSFYLNLKKGKAESRQAFMAMKFGDSVLDSMYLNHFKTAVKDTGFELKRLDEEQPAGLIDDYLRVEIRKSKFLIADLTHHNNGAYWEAGYAEGLGKKVIYTCRKDIFDDKENTTHFDANHHLTVVWEQDKLEDAAKRLKATIRATLTEEAKLEDD